MIISVLRCCCKWLLEVLFLFCCDFLFCHVIFGGNVHLGGVSGSESVSTLEDAS